MNDQIKNLYQQARAHANAVYASMEVEPEGEFDEWFNGIVNEKFSELIVLKCMTICKNNEYYDADPSPETNGHIRAGASFCREDIKSISESKNERAN